MKVKELKELLKNIADDVEIVFPTYINTNGYTIEANSFLHDIDKIADFLTLSKEEFLKSYSYLTEFDYEETKKELHDNLSLQLEYLWDSIEQKMIDEEVDVSYIKQAVLDYAEKHLPINDYKEFCKYL